MQFLTVIDMQEALEHLDSLGSRATILAGGTDVMIQLPRHELEIDVLLHIERIPELKEIRKNGCLQIGALVSHREIACNQATAEYSSLRQASASVGGWQTQYAGTIGGNICNASPAADTVPPLLVHGAKVTLASLQNGNRTIGLQSFITGRRETDRGPNELLTSITLEAPQERTADVYMKVGRRSATEVAIVGLAVRLSLADDLETVADARIAVCSVGPSAYRVTAAEKMLRGQVINDELLAEAGQVLTESASPIDDIRASRNYRLAVLPRVLKAAVNDCIGRLQGVPNLNLSE